MQKMAGDEAVNEREVERLKQEETISGVAGRLTRRQKDILL